MAGDRRNLEDNIEEYIVAQGDKIMENWLIFFWQQNGSKLAYNARGIAAHRVIICVSDTFPKIEESDKTIVNMLLKYRNVCMVDLMSLWRMSWEGCRLLEPNLSRMTLTLWPLVSVPHVLARIIFGTHTPANTFLSTGLMRMESYTFQRHPFLLG